MGERKNRNVGGVDGRLVCKNEEESRGERGVERVCAKDLPEGRPLMMMMINNKHY